MRFDRWIMLAILSAALTAGCSGEDSEQSTSSGTSTSVQDAREGIGGVEAGESGFGIARSSGGSGLPDYVWAVTMVANHSDRITGLTASFALYDHSGQVIGQSETSAPVLRAGASLPVGTIVEVPAGSEVDKVVATVTPLENLSEKDEHPESVFVTQGVHLQTNPALGSAEVLGEVVSRYQQPVKEVYVSVICFDAADRIIGGGEHYITMIQPGKSVGFSTDSLTVTGAPARCDAYATLSGLSAS